MSGCSIFKRTEKKIDKVEQSAKVERSEEQQKSESENRKEDSKSSESTQYNERDQRDIDSQTTIEADNISIDKDGNISAIGNAKISNKTKDKGASEKNENKTVHSSSGVEAYKQSSDQSKQTEEQENKQKVANKETVSSPSLKGIISGTVAFVLLVIVMAWWFFGVGKKKRSNNI